MRRRLRYQVAVSLDGFIAGPSGEFDWIVMDPAIDFGALFEEFDTAVMGRRTYEVMKAQGGAGAMPGIEVVVFSRTLPATTQPGIRIVNDDPGTVVRALKAKPGRDIWLYGGGDLFRSLLDAGLVDTVEVAVIPVLLGAGVPLLPPGAATKLVLADQKTLPASGIVALAYEIPGGVGPAPRIRYIKPATRRKKAGTSSRSSKPSGSRAPSPAGPRSTPKTSPATKRRGARKAPSATKRHSARKAARKRT